MSKTVIVFSTRYIDPLNKHYKDRLFSGDHFHRKIFTSKLLADYFWNDIKKDKNLLRRLLINDYFLNKQKQELVDFLNTKKIELEEVIQCLDPTKSFSTTEFTWIGNIFATGTDFPLKKELRAKHHAYRISIQDTTLIEREDSLEICEKLKTDTKQKSYNLDPAEPGVEGPWMTYRFSYYELNNNNNDVSVYAVWPLERESPYNKGKYPWIEALMDQFLTILNPDAKEIFLLLHDNDIKDHTPFKIIIDDTAGTVARHVALFQHDNLDEIGSFLSKTPNNISPEDVKSYIEGMVMEARIRNWLFEAYDYFTNDDTNKLWNASANLIKLDENKFKAIFEIADKIEGGTPTATKQHLDELKLSLISILNQKLRDYMIINNSKD